jgi:hypothetical protein
LAVGSFRLRKSRPASTCFMVCRCCAWWGRRNCGRGAGLSQVLGQARFGVLQQLSRGGRGRQGALVGLLAAWQVWLQGLALASLSFSWAFASSTRSHRNAPGGARHWRRRAERDRRRPPARGRRSLCRGPWRRHSTRVVRSCKCLRYSSSEASCELVCSGSGQVGNGSGGVRRRGAAKIAANAAPANRDRTVKLELPPPRAGATGTAFDGQSSRCVHSSRFHQPLDVIAFAAHALIIVEEG